MKFKETCTLPIALVVGGEVGNLICSNTDSYSVEFPIYGAGFSLPSKWFDVIVSANTAIL